MVRRLDGSAMKTPRNGCDEYAAEWLYYVDCRQIILCISIKHS